MPHDPLQPKKCAKLLAALASPERLKIVTFLAKGPRNVTEIASAVGVSALNLYHHLNILKGAALVRRKKQGRFVVYSLCPGFVENTNEGGVSKDYLNLGCCRLEISLDYEYSRSSQHDENEA